MLKINKQPNKMQITTSTVRNWKKYMDHGDIKEISLQSGIPRLRISLALKNKEASQETIEAIQAFVDQKKQILK